MIEVLYITFLNEYVTNELHANDMKELYGNDKKWEALITSQLPHFRIFNVQFDDPSISIVISPTIENEINQLRGLFSPAPPEWFSSQQIFQQRSDKCTLEKLKLIVDLCPRVEHLSIDTWTDVIEQITRFLFCI